MEDPGRLRNEELQSLPLFPLPTTVLFPRTDLRLHVFEPRYLAMLEHCMQSHGVMAVVLLRPGFERDYQGCPPVYEVAGAGRIRKAQRLPDGSFEILLRGSERVRVLEEEPPSDRRPFRTARCARLKEKEPREDMSELDGCLRGLALRVAGAVPEIRRPIVQLLEEIEDGGILLADQLACRLIPDPYVRQQVL
ncbi:MAG: LON peptidase substrate-binding domain-containing protein, partial [Myxococcota bacterium]